MANKDRNRESQSNLDWDQRRNRSENDYQNGNQYGRYDNMSNDHQSGQHNQDHRKDSENQHRYRNTNVGNEYGFGGASSANQYDQENDWNQRQRQGNSGMYGNDFGRDRSDWQRRNINAGSGSYGNSGKIDRENYSERNSGRTRNMYGGDTSNYGNANQGGFDRGWWDRTKDEVSSWFGDDDAERRRRVDESRSGEHRGKGPKDYQRSEERIREDVCDRLSDDDRVDASNIQVQVQKNEVILTGNVSNRDEKRRAEDLVESISGVRNVENRIRVGNPHNQGSIGLE